jgi:hypothetical protein
MATYETVRQLATYRAATAETVVAPADPTAFFLITGSASKDVLVRKIAVSGATLTAVAYNSYVVEKFSTAFSGGTATALTKVPTDSRFAASTVGTCQVYTAAPTEGTLVGTLACRRVLLQATTAAAGGQPEVVEFDFTTVDGGGILLRGVAQAVGLAFGGDPASAVTVGVEVEWQEL